MKSKINQFALALGTLALVGQLLILYVYEPVTGLKPTVLVQLFPSYFLIINLIVHYYLLRSAEHSPKKFVRVFMGMTSAKMMISLIFTLVIGLASRPDFKAPVITFVVFYLLFMVLEVVFIVKDLNKLKNKS
jgi:L-asparagine transporter-like permease